MKKIKTTAQQRQIGKKCNCFYKGKIYPCEVVGFKGKCTYTVCRIEELGMEVNVRSTHVNWTNDPKVEEIWLDEYEEKKDRKERLRETRTAMQQAVRDKISMNRRNVTIEKPSKRKQKMEPNVLKALQNRMKSLCEVGSQAVSQLLNVLQRSGESSARLYRLALDIEKLALSCYQHDGKGINEFNRIDRERLLVELVECCRLRNVPFGHPAGNKDVMCVWLPECEILSYPITEWQIKTDELPLFPYPWDGKHLMNLRKIENAITKKCGWYLRLKYPDRFL